MNARGIPVVSYAYLEYIGCRDAYMFDGFTGREFYVLRADSDEKAKNLCEALSKLVYGDLKSSPYACPVPLRDDENGAVGGATKEIHNALKSATESKPQAQKKDRYSHFRVRVTPSLHNNAQNIGVGRKVKVGYFLESEHIACVDGHNRRRLAQ
jgi:hypothetical protein